MLDDFGTGYASLSMLKNLPVDVLKIDRGFVNELTNSTETQTLVKAMVAMAKALELKIVVEGVETEEQYLWLQQQRVDYFQGYWLGRPKASFLSTE
jgi:EAL domain-containing protein (putative c-di-GMP-specific phosphodiesterase class I)